MKDHYYKVLPHFLLKLFVHMTQSNTMIASESIETTVFSPVRVLLVLQVLRVWLVSVVLSVCQDSAVREVSLVCPDRL